MSAPLFEDNNPSPGLTDNDWPLRTDALQR